MRTLLLHLDTSPRPSVFDRIVAYDGGADAVMSYGGVVEGDVRDLVHGVIFTRGPKDLHSSAIFVGGADIVAGEKVLAAVRQAFMGPLRASVLFDSNGSNTTAVAAVSKLRHAVSPEGDIRGRRAVVTAGSGPVGLRAAGLLARAGAAVTVTTRRSDTSAIVEYIRRRFEVDVRAVTSDAADAAGILDGAEILLNAGAAGVRMVPRNAWLDRSSLRAAADLNAVPPLGVEGIDVMDNGVDRSGTATFGALGVGSLKMKIHKACIAHLFERNDLVLDAETIAEVAARL